MSSILNSNYDSLCLSPIKSTSNSTNHYENEFYNDSLNSNSIDINMSTNNFTIRDIPSNNETNFWTTPIIEKLFTSLLKYFLNDKLKMFYFSHHGVFQI